jgi:hypothetical protein
MSANNNHPVLSPVVPLDGAEGKDVLQRTFGRVLEVVAADGGWAPPRGAQHMEVVEQTHRQPHTHVHLADMDEDRH